MGVNPEQLDLYKVIEYTAHGDTHRVPAKCIRMKPDEEPDRILFVCRDEEWYGASGKDKVLVVTNEHFRRASDNDSFAESFVRNSNGNYDRLKKELRIASISDVHLGHRRTPASHILKNLKAAFPKGEETRDLDIIFIAGDLFDAILSFPDPVVEEIQDWMFAFIRMCASYNIVVRILEGTPLHDRNQSREFDVINRNLRAPANCKYQDTLCIEHIEALDINVLYVPDEWDVDTDRTWEAVQELLAVSYTHLTLPTKA